MELIMTPFETFSILALLWVWFLLKTNDHKPGE